MTRMVRKHKGRMKKLPYMHMCNQPGSASCMPKMPPV